MVTWLHRRCWGPYFNRSDSRRAGRCEQRATTTYIGGYYCENCVKHFYRTLYP